MATLNMKPIGYSGLKQWGGYIYEEFNRRLYGNYAAKVYREMSDNSSTIGAVRHLIKSLVRQVDWRFEPRTQTRDAIEQAAFAESCINDMSHTFADFISEVLSFLDYGWAYFETIYKYRQGDTKRPHTHSQYSDGKIGWRKFALRSQDTLQQWEFDERDDILGMHQLTSTGQYAFIPITKSILFRTETYKNNPEGRSIYRNAVIDWFYLKRICEIEAVGIERDLTGLPVLQVPANIMMTNATDAEVALREDLETMMGEIKRNERAFIIMPSELNSEGQPTGYKFELVASGGQHQVDTDKTKMYYKINILQSVVAQFLQLGMANVGSYALSSSQTNLFSIALGAYLNVITETFNRFAVRPLMKFNDVPPENWPHLVHGDIESPALDEMGRYVQSLAVSGQLPEDAAIQRKLLEIANLPLPPLEEGEIDQPRKGIAPIRTLPSSSK